jgi:hypothetical protein
MVALTHISRITAKERTDKDFLADGQSLHMYIKETFGYNDYFANSVINVIEAAIDSHRELHQLNIQSLKDRIATKEKKLKQLRQHLKGKLAMLKSCIRISKASKQAKPRKKDIKLKTYRGCREKQLPYGYAVCYRKYCRIYYNLPGVQRRRHELWLDKWRHQRNKSFKIVGRGDGKYGNFVFKYDTGTRELKVQLQQKAVTLSNIVFPYGQNLLDEVLENRTLKRPLTWEIEDRGDYYIIKVMFEPPPTDRNYYTGDGVISYDTNYDHIAWTELDAKGRLLRYSRIPLLLDGKSTGQAAKIIEAAAIGLVGIAREA